MSKYLIDKTQKKKRHFTRSVFSFCCGPKEIRTPDLSLAKRLLYQLSYRPKQNNSTFFLFFCKIKSLLTLNFNIVNN